MGRPVEGWKLRWKRGWAYVNFTWDSVEYKFALHTCESREAEEAAAQRYAEVVSGRRRPLRRTPGKLLDLAELWDAWCVRKAPSIHPDTLESIESYGRRFVDYFKELDQITEASGADYGLARLGQVTRSTTLRELCYLRQFLAWCKQQGVLRETVLIPGLPPKSLGKRTGTHRQKAIEITEDEAKAIIALLPEHSKTIGGRKWPLRDRFAFMWETALRPGTLARLRVPEHWRPRLKHLVVIDEIDKARFGRELDLTPEALRILRKVAPSEGLVFGQHEFAKALKKAAKAVLGPVRGKQFAPYDFRHGRARDWLDAGAPLRGVAYLLGHKRVSTTNKYLEPSRRAGQDALRVSGPFPDPAPKRPQKAG